MKLWEVCVSGKKNGSLIVKHIVAESKKEAEEIAKKKMGILGDNFYFSAIEFTIKDYDIILVPKGEGL